MFLNWQQGQAYAACALANLCAHLICREGFHLANGIQHVPRLLGSEEEEVQTQALRLLVAISGELKIRSRAGACIPPLVALLADVEWNSRNAELFEHAVLVLLQLGQDSAANLALIVENRGILTLHRRPF